MYTSRPGKRRKKKHHPTYNPGRIRYVAVLMHYMLEPLPEYRESQKHSKTSFYRRSTHFFNKTKHTLKQKQRNVCVCYRIM